MTWQTRLSHPTVYRKKRLLNKCTFNQIACCKMFILIVKCTTLSTMAGEVHSWVSLSVLFAGSKQSVLVGSGIEQNKFSLSRPMWHKVVVENSVNNDRYNCSSSITAPHIFEWKQWSVQILIELLTQWRQSYRERGWGCGGHWGPGWGRPTSPTAWPTGPCSVALRWPSRSCSGSTGPGHRLAENIWETSWANVHL